MPKTFFISDTHFGHENVIKYDNRPFASLEEMEEEMIKRWNSAVGKGDNVYILGDFCWTSKPELIVGLLKRLNGNKMLIKGNHDRGLDDKKVKNAFGQYIKETDKICINGKNIVMSHYPIASWKKMQRRNPEENSILLYGHVHMSDEFKLFEKYLDMLREMKQIPIRAYNVGSMCLWMDYQPRTLEEIMERYETMKNEVDWAVLPAKKPVTIVE